MSVSTELIKELRQATGAGVLECRNALQETDGDLEKASALLRERGLARAAKRSSRETRDGVVELYSHGNGRVGVMVEINCETDFVARTEEFRHFAHEMALQIAATSPTWVSIEDVPEEVAASARAELRAQAEADGKPENVVDRIVEGRLKKYFDQACLLEQVYIRDDLKSVSQLLQETIAATGENITIRRFKRWEVGEDAG